MLLMLSEGALISRHRASERYAMHEFIRQYAAEQLADHSEEERETRARHAAFYAAVVQQLTPALRQTIAAQEAISADMSNIRAAWDWATERADAGVLEQMLEGLAQWHKLQGLPGQAVEMLEQAAGRLRTALLQAATPEGLDDMAPNLSKQRLLGFVLNEAAAALNWRAAYIRALVLLEEARELARLTASPHLEGSVALNLGFLLGRQRDPRHVAQWQQALELARAARAPTLEAAALHALGYGATWAGKYPQARVYLAQALSLFHTQHDHSGEVEVTYYLGLIAHACGNFGEAQRLIEGALQLTRVLG
jgi:tetratricopeptide (TPR) repeat protein